MCEAEVVEHADNNLPSPEFGGRQSVKRMVCQRKSCNVEIIVLVCTCALNAESHVWRSCRPTQF